jgi:hypothetical protein
VAEVLQTADAETTSKFHAKQLEVWGLDSNTVRCVNCPNREELDDVKAQELGHVWTCDPCGWIMCIKCKPETKLAGSYAEYFAILGQEPPPIHVCREVQTSERQELENVLNAALFAFCPTESCQKERVPIVREDGCNVIKCLKCRLRLCYACSAPLGQDSMEAHNKYPHYYTLPAKPGGARVLVESGRAPEGCLVCPLFHDSGFVTEEERTEYEFQKVFFACEETLHFALCGRGREKKKDRGV